MASTPLVIGRDEGGSRQAARWRAPGSGTLVALILCLVIAAPLVALLGYAFQPTGGLWAHLVDTVLGEYLRTSAFLTIGVGAATLSIGAAAAWLVTVYEFPGRRVLTWALVLPLAMPAYVLAYAYTDFLQVTGPLQTGLRVLTGWSVHDYWFPNIRSLGGAVFVLSAVLYPYVYVLARAAFAEQSQCAIEVSRTLGCSPFAAFRRIGLPMARPAIATGLAFVMMETLADFGAVGYFELRTFTTGIYRAWYASGSPAAAAQLASLLLLLVFGVIALEWAARGRASFAANTTHLFKKQRLHLSGAKGVAAAIACALPVLFGFVLPVVVLVWMTATASDAPDIERLVELARNTLTLAGMASVLIVTVAVVALYAVGRVATTPAAKLVRVAAFGYAVPGAVIGVGILITVGAADAGLGDLRSWLGFTGHKLVIGGTVAALLYAYLVRFFAVGYNPLEAGLAKIGPTLGDAARVLGCRPVQSLRRVVLPMLRPSLISAGLLVLVDVMKELPATMILRPFNFDTLAVEAFQLATTERLDGAAAPSLLIMLAGLVPVIMLCRMLDRGRAASLAH
ncbi:MAG: iron ABC transporter permease [Geminicoccaceae bacterium]